MGGRAPWRGRGARGADEGDGSRRGCGVTRSMQEVVGTRCMVVVDAGWFDPASKVGEEAGDARTGRVNGAAAGNGSDGRRG